MPAPTATAIKSKTAMPTPALPPLDAAIDRIQNNRLTGVKNALIVYRGAVMKLVDDRQLADAETEALAHAIHLLGFSSQTLKDDVAGVKSHRAQLKFAADCQAIVKELEPQMAGLGAELERLQARKLEIGGIRARHQSHSMQATQHEGEAWRLASVHDRILGDLDSQVAKIANPQPVGPRIIRSNPVDPSVIRNAPAPDVYSPG